ncbi:MAG: KH domain-containing protein [Firmicutes bacterium]|nr:KH domain-containing protein [Bacillota bacterium]
MIELVKYIVTNLVDNPDKIVVTQEGEVIKVTVDKPDMGKIIGKQGNIAKSIKTIVRGAAIKQNVRVQVEIVDEQ